ncbi:acyltransferase family protein [Streptomyces profundus]|uniref:acyltransferase family protein n=1 Tax=Streptomyces profundus TaxID=2867410 RepID=UPI001D15F7EE|nr:acyltransferase family protein [Streptomyces sp. MA3_2.13]UED86468.1 acyltransferase family protein [Streptomyces sp. MA3_2.13]
MTGSPPSTERPRSPQLPQQGARPKQRDAFFDNAKYLAIVLVAVGHAWEPLRADSRVVTSLYMFVYAFHMPAFILIAGYFSRNFDGRPDRVRRLVTGVLVPYVVFQVAYTYFLRRLDENDNNYLPLFEPRWLLWFLVALFIWRLTVPLWKAVRWPVPLALLLAAVATASPTMGSDLQLQRVVQFLPYFVLGMTLRPEHFQLVRRRSARLLALPILAVAAVIAYWAEPRMEYAWFYHRGSAQELGEPWWAGVLMTLALFGCAVLLTACFLALVPGRHAWFTALGAGTLYGYLLHGFLIRGSVEWGWYDPEPMQNIWTGLLITTVVAAVGISLLCAPPVQRLLRPLVEPQMKWFFKREALTGPKKPTAPSPQETAARDADTAAPRS